MGFHVVTAFRAEGVSGFYCLKADVVLDATRTDWIVCYFGAGGFVRALARLSGRITARRWAPLATTATVSQPSKS